MAGGTGFPSMRESLAHKTAVIVGGTSGIGYGIAEAMVLAGAEVVVVGRDADRSDAASARLRELGSKRLVTGLTADVQDRVSLVEMFSRAEQAHGAITTIVCAAGVGVAQRVSRTSEEDWHVVLSVNLTGVWRTASLALLRMRQDVGSSIITIGSDTSLVPDPLFGVYSVSKVAVVTLTRLLALDAAASAIRVNCICPGYVEPGMRDFPNRMRESNEPEPEPLPPLGRHGQPRDIGAAAVYLASDAASFVTGAVIAVDGGYTAGPTQGGPE
jgi:NAD(P)-dependent dehydrogenase (short-subunit alcohol dehydrogenase family)